MTLLDDRKKVLFLSVGGSPQPLRSSLREGRPDHVVFVVSDGHDGSQSSQDTAKELLQADGCPLSHCIVPVPPDDIDVALASIEPRLSKTLAEGASVIVDYTGGTKSMTSAMVLAATLHEGVCLQFMAGTRVGLTGVEDGTEKPVEIPAELIGLSRTFGIVREFVGRRNYGAALAVLREIDGSFRRLQRKVPGVWRKRVGEWQKWVAIFDCWDRFDHVAARDKLQNGLECRAPHAMWFEEEGSAFQVRLEKLASHHGFPSYDLLEDLWLNAERRARLGLHDDAVARLYRLMEAAVQTRLWSGHEIETSNVPVERLPECLREKCSRHGRSESAKLGLSDALRVLAHLDPNDPLPGAMKAGRQDWQGSRNHSILAHGFKPLGGDDWKRVRQWFAERSEVLWKGQLGRSPSGQLPDKLPVL